MDAASQSQSRASGPVLVENPRGEPWGDRERLRKGASRWWALSAALALAFGLGLRLWMLKHFFEVNGDPLIYGGLAKNLLLHGRFALTVASGEVYPTLIRLPGYPLYLALCWRLFGMENYASAAWMQIGLELLGCVLLADFAGRIARSRNRRGAALATLWLAALCPFTAIYAAQPLTESLTLFTLCGALNAAARFSERPRWGSALAFTAAVTYAALLRPDGALVGVALAPAMALVLWEKTIESRHLRAGSQEDAPVRLYGLRPVPIAEARTSSGAKGFGRGKTPFGFLRMGLICLLLALAPFAVWTARNWRVFHVFEPLAPRFATDPGENTWPGWQRWMKTWCLDFVSTYDVYWNVPGDTLDPSKLPARAFDSTAQFEETAALAADYNKGHELSPEIDARFAELAAERVRANPLRYYVWLPVGRLADMTLRPRVENLPIDLDWWAYARHRVETRFSWAYAGLNALYLLLALGGLSLRPRLWPWMVAYFVLRGLLLMNLEAPEARYTLEFFPMFFALGGVYIAHLLHRLRTGLSGDTPAPGSKARI